MLMIKMCQVRFSQHYVMMPKTVIWLSVQCEEITISILFSKNVFDVIRSEFLTKICNTTSLLQWINYSIL